MTRSSPSPFLILLFSIAITATIGCSQEPDAEKIIDRAIEAHGGRVLDNALVEFDFRGRHFRAERQGGLFRYERRFTDSTGNVRDVLTNDSLYRTVNGQPVQLTDQQRASIETGVNSVVYFALLPYNLNDPAVRKRHLGTSEINGTGYHEIEVTFEQQGGGRDFEDRFIYWINRESHTMDYLAYLFHVNGGGTRFRQAVNPRRVGGVLFTDQLNFTSAALGERIEEYETAFQTGGLEQLSAVVLENVRVTALGEQ